jgi:hypothetical protein
MIQSLVTLQKPHVILITVYTNRVTNSKSYENQGSKVGSRHTISLEKPFVEDSAFPFKPEEPIAVKIEKNRLVVEKADAK